MTTTDPTLADFARLLAKAKERWPDAPGLPEGYKIAHGRGMAAMFAPNAETALPDEAALALCITTAMEIGAWWEEHHGHVFHIYSIHGTEGVEWQAHTLGTTPTNAHHPTLAAAALAGLGAIVEGEP